MSTRIGSASQPKLISVVGCRELSWFGSKHRFLLCASETGGSMSMFEGEYPVGAGTPPHVHHREDEMFEVLEGRFKFMTGDTFVEAGPGDVVWAPRGVPHCFSCVSDRPGRLRFTVTPGGIEKMFEELAMLPPGPPDLAKVSEICGRYDLAFV